MKMIEILAKLNLRYFNIVMYFYKNICDIRYVSITFAVFFLISGKKSLDICQHMTFLLDD